MFRESAFWESRDRILPRALGKYVPLARLGSGGMAEVFLTMSRGPLGFNKLAVVKRLRQPDDAAQIEMFLDEARLAARLNHPNIVHTYEVGEADGKYFIAMEYLEGQSLQSVVARLKSRSAWLTDAVVAYVATQALKGLHFAHELCDFDGTALAVVHRDVSPHNLYVTYGGDVKLLDFGVAKAKMNTAHTQIGMLKGKIRYMAPEQLGDGRVDCRADVFAFGIVFWELLARRPLFQGDAPSVMARVVSEDAPLLSSVRPDVAPELEAIALKALKRKPVDRYATADEMRAELENFLRGRDDAFDREVARLMNEKFADVRDEVRGRIKAFLKDMPKEGDAESDPRPGDFARTGELPMLTRSNEGAVHGTPSVSAASAIVRPRPSRWSWLLLAVGASISGVVALARLSQHLQDRAGVPSETARSPPLIGAAEALPIVSLAASTLPSTPACASASPPDSESLAPAASSSASARSAPARLPVSAPRSPQRPAGSASPRTRVNIRVLDDGDGP